MVRRTAAYGSTNPYGYPYDETADDLMGSTWGEVVKQIMGEAQTGFKLSEKTGIYLRVAKSLIDKGKLNATPLSGGDFLVSK